MDRTGKKSHNIWNQYLEEKYGRLVTAFRSHNHLPPKALPMWACEAERLTQQLLEMNLVFCFRHLPWRRQRPNSQDGKPFSQTFEKSQSFSIKTQIRNHNEITCIIWISNPPKSKQIQIYNPVHSDYSVCPCLPFSWGMWEIPMELVKPPSFQQGQRKQSLAWWWDTENPL